MPSGARFNGVDFDDIFEPGTVVASPNLIRQGGGPLQYAARGSVPKYQDVGLRVGGSDVSNLWLPKGSAPPPLPIDGQSFVASATAAIDSVGTTEAIIAVTLNPSGTFEVQETRVNSITPGITVLASGTWLPSGGAAADYEVQFSGSATGGAVVNGATVFTSLAAARQYSLAASVPSVSTLTAEWEVAPFYINLRRVGAAASSTVLALNAVAHGNR